MSRKWERLVLKNKKKANEDRLKQGLKPITGVNNKGESRHLGRSWVLPSVLVAIAVVYAFTTSNSTQGTSIFWVTIGSYLGLALLIFLIRRPFVKIGQTRLACNKMFGLEKSFEAAEITKIILNEGFITVEMKRNTSRLMFTRLINRYDMTALVPEMRIFAHRNGIPIEET